mmetsp:Transcript_7966/g.11833  ORF Transcript_7966/g.11833 Transcript_7966/m.11833 type:complete len:189 (-) Transcript_7966:142-708(-)|eukprot:CAMPEP_0117419104 /NCGR_PEP_ID=MMETSP0758-20121206/746_1 /TAXON_ID=63605 /ORGANISM="Percolomonas cosmopolitus, Strain AE-1 (ATCC 50343)" /LENGTH=188 /DNA_ID=CAMNT_0005199995 /DNA_START=10 /DNA_END=576 /DNA_ORIENTATION=-
MSNVAYLRKLKKRNNEKPTELEKKVANTIFDLEVHNNDLNYQLQTISFVGAREIKVSSNRDAIIIFVHKNELKEWQEIHENVVSELEKKFPGKHVLIVAQRRALTDPKNPFVSRPRSRTLAEVTRNMMNDVCFPVQITGVRTRVKLDGSEIIRVHLDQKQRDNYASKTKTYGAAFHKLTGKTCYYQFE